MERALPANALAAEVARWAVTSVAVVLELTDGRLLAWFAGCGWVIDPATSDATSLGRRTSPRVRPSSPVPAA